MVRARVRAPEYGMAKDTKGTKPGKAPAPGYLEQVISMALRRGPAPGVHHVVVEHEDHCPMINGGHDCTCAPDITFTEGNA